MDNIFLVRDMLDVCKMYNVNVGVLSIDQMKAFDRIQPDFLFATLRAFGIGEVFRSYVGLLYKEASCMVRVGGELSCPIPMKRGIRQGCPISGQLYCLALEPLLIRLRRVLTGLPLSHIYKWTLFFK